MKRLAMILLPVVAAVVLLVLAITPVATATPLAAVSPRVVLVNSAAVATDATQTSRTVNWVDYTEADFFWDIDMENGVNTTTVTLWVSPDAVTWYAHGDTPTPVNAAAASVESYEGSIAVEGYYMRVQWAATNTNSVTPKLKMVLR